GGKETRPESAPLAIQPREVPARRTVLGVGSTRRPAATSLAWASCPSDLLRAALRTALPGVEKQADALRNFRCARQATRGHASLCPPYNDYADTNRGRRCVCARSVSERVQGSPSEPPRVGLSAGVSRTGM